jgi:hypothetical protein
VPLSLAVMPGMVLVTGKVTTLEHELRDDTVERAAGISLLSDPILVEMYESVLSGTQFTKVLCRLGDNIIVQFANGQDVLATRALGRGRTRRFCPWGRRWWTRQSKRWTCLRRYCTQRIEI